MFSSFRTLRALLLLTSSCPLVFSSPSAFKTTLVARRFEDYLNNIIYIDANQTSLYAPLSSGRHSYAAKLDNKWDGLLLQRGGNTTQTIPVVVGGTKVQASLGRGGIELLEQDVDLQYYQTPQWPGGLPSFNMKGIDSAYMGIDINSGMSPPYYYFSQKWPNDYEKWYYDILITYNWNEGTTTRSKDGDFAGLLVAGHTLNWTDVFAMQPTVVDSWNLPNFDGIADQPEIHLTEDGMILIDSAFWVNGQQVNFTSQVPKTASGKVVADIQLSRRWSMAPDDVVNALYGGAKGAKYTPESAYGYWTIPCDTPLQLSFSINDQKYNVDPDALIAPNPWGERCIGTVFTKGQAVAAVPEYDMIFGFQYMSSFYFRAGINHSSNMPYYKLLAIDVPEGGWASAEAPMRTSTYSDHSTISSVSSAIRSWVSTVTSDLPSYASHTPSSSWLASSTFAYSSYTPVNPNPTALPSDSAIKAAGNLAATDEDEDSEQTKSWRDKAQLFEILTIAFASLFGLTLIASLAVCIRTRRSKRNATRPSAYRTLHEADFDEPKASLYDAEGGQSKYADPYRDQH